MLLLTQQQWNRAFGKISEAEIKLDGFDYNRFYREYHSYASNSMKSKMPRQIKSSQFIRDMLKRLPYLRSLAADGTVRFVGVGSSRVCYIMRNGQALKLAMTEAGIAQNKQEINNCTGTDKYCCFPQIYNYDGDEFLFLVSECCKKCDRIEWKDAFNGFVFEEVINEVIDYVDGQCKSIDDMIDSLKDTIHDAIQKEDYDDASFAKKSLMFFSTLKSSQLPSFDSIKDLFQFYKSNDSDKLLTDDLQYIENWGFAERDGKKFPVIIDAGFSGEVRNRFYNS